MSKRKLLLLVSGVLFLLCICVTALVLIAREDGEVTKETKEAPKVELTVALATATSQIVSTPAPKPLAATNTPEPTSTSWPTKAPKPSDTPKSALTQIPSTVTPAILQVTFVSGAIGLDRSQWEQEHIKTRENGMFIEYDNAKYSVIFADNRIQYVELSFEEDQPSLQDARSLAAKLFPDDARLIETYSPEGSPELIVDLYMSDSLAQRIEPIWFIGGEPGNFTAIYGVFDGKVPRVIVATGNNP